MMRLLLAIDGSDCSAPPVRAITTRPWPPGSEIRILTVIENQYPAGFVPEAPLVTDFAAVQKAQRDKAEAVIERARQIVDTAGLPVSTRIRTGVPGQEIVDEAGEWRADLIVVGSHGRTGLRRILMGSVAQYVVQHALCSVEVVRAADEAMSETRT